MQSMYPGKVNSPSTTLDGVIDDSVTTIDIIDGAVLPSAPNLAVIGTGEDAETILYATKVGNQLSNITRGFQGVSKAWSTGEVIARLFTEYDYKSLKENITEIGGRKISDFAECNSEELAGKVTDELGVGKLMFGTEGEWTPSLKFGGNSVGMSYSVQNGLYTKVGRKVTITCIFYLSSKGTSIGEATLNGLPFTCKNDDGAYTPVNLHFHHVTFANVFQGYIHKGATHIVIREITEGGTATNLDNTNFIDDSQILFNVSYFTD